MEMDNQQLSSKEEKVQRLSLRGVDSSGSKWVTLPPIGEDEDIVCTLVKVREANMAVQS